MASELSSITRAAFQAYASQRLRNAMERPQPAASKQPTEKQAPKEFGFKIGKFGIRFSTEEPAVDPELLAREALERFRKQQALSFSQEMDAALLRQALTEPETPQTPDSALTRAQGLKSYAQAQQVQEEAPLFIKADIGKV